jgi:hypothetical protein
MWGLAIGAAMGGGIAALRGGKTDDILKGAIMGGATGAVGGGISSLASAGTAGAAGAGVANVAPGAGASILENAGASTISPALAGQSSSMTSLFPNAAGSLSGVSSGVPTIASTGTNLAASQAAPVGTGFFDSGIGKFISDNKMPLGIGAAGLLALNKPSSNQNDQQQESYIRPYEFNQSENPDYQGAGTPYFKQSYTAKAPIKASEYGATTVANGGAIRMAEGGDVPTTQEQRENRTNPTLEALAAIQQAQQTYQPPAPAVSQGITQPLIQPQMAQIQQQYAAPQRQAPAAFQYEAPAFVKYGTGAGSGSYGSGGGGGVDELIDPVTKQPVKTAAQIIAANAVAAKKPAVNATNPENPTTPYTPYTGGTYAPNDTYNGPGVNGDAESYYDRYPVAEVYDYANNTPTRPDNPTSGSPEFNIPSNVPVDPSSGMAATQQDYANMGYVDYLPNPHNVDGGGGANGGLMPDALRYAMGGGIGSYYPEPDDASHNFGGIGSLNQGPQYPMQGIGYAMGGHLGGYSDGGQLLKGPGNGTSDDIPAVIGNKQPARLADGEFVVPSRIVSELGNGSTDAGAKQLYAMMDRIQSARRKTVGKNKVAFDAKARNQLPA